MMLIDSNIIIYAAKPEHTALRRFIAENAPYVSVVSYVEVLGFHNITPEEKLHFEEFFKAASLLEISKAILDQAVMLRQQRKMTLGDSLIAATALVHSLTLVTCNTEDFTWITNLQILDPLAKKTGG